MRTLSALIFVLFVTVRSDDFDLGGDDDEDNTVPARTDDGQGGGSEFQDSGDAGPEPHPDEIMFSSEDDEEHPTLMNIVFDPSGKVQEGGSTHPDIFMWHVVEINGQRLGDPVEAAGRLQEAMEQKQSYLVKFAPPTLEGFKCTEKVENLATVFDREWHDHTEEFVNGALEVLKTEGIINTKQLFELHEKDLDGIRIPAIIKSRLRKIKSETREMFEAAEAAAKGIDINSEAVNNELREFMEARAKSQGVQPAASAAPVEAAKTEAPVEVVEQEEEDGTFKSLVWAIMNCPTCKGKDTVACFRTCRYGGALDEEKKKHTWSECLDKCISNRWLRATFAAMLPREKTV